MDVIMPQLGETVAEGVVTKWYKRVGDTVKADETLFDVETDKVSTEIPAPVSGVIAQILVQEGVTETTGAVIRDTLVRFDRLPLVVRLPDLPSVAADTRVRIAIGRLDLVAATLECRFAGEEGRG